MADKNSFFDALKDFLEELEAAGVVENNRNDNARPSNLETNGHYTGINSSHDCYRNVPTTSYSRETRVSSNSSAQFNIPVYGRGHGISTLQSIDGAQPSSSGVSEESRASTSRLPVVVSSGSFYRINNNQTNLHSQNYFQRSICRPVPEREPQNASFGADINSSRKKENSASIFFPEQILTCPQIPKEREESGAVIQTGEDDRQLSSASAVFPPIQDVWSIEMATGRASVAGPSGTRTRSIRNEGVRRFQCDVCWKSFVRIGHLEDHKRTHTGEKPFTCDDCGKRFALRSNLTKHRVVHSDIKLFNCPKCGKKFRRKYDLVKHIRTHTKEKPFTCDTYNRVFSHKCSLVRHRRTHTREQPVICELCGRYFASREECTEHQKREHGRK